MKPDFITFTGVDSQTDLSRLAPLSGRYPIEWGVLFSRNRQGIDNRYPDMEVVHKVLELAGQADIRLAAHLCGKYAQHIMEGSFDRISLPLAGFSRIQVNHTSPDPRRLADFAVAGQPVIAQWREPESFPSEYMGIEWLYDPSGGRGLSPDRWPTNPAIRRAGYAGGINSENVSAIVGAIESPAGYWIDMESGVRSDNWFDLDLVERVCAEVYGA